MVSQMKERSKDDVEITLHSTKKSQTIAKLLLDFLNSPGLSALEKGDIIFRIILSKFVDHWRDFLNHLENILESLLELDFKRMGYHSLSLLTTLLADLRSILNAVNNVISFSVLFRVVATYVVGKKLKKFFGLKRLIWLSLILFLYVQLRSRWLMIEQIMKTLLLFSYDLNAFYEGPIKQYYQELMDDLQENNPELHSEIQSRIEKLQMLLSVPRFLLEKLFSLCSFSWSYLSSIEPYVKQILDTIDTLFLSFAENGAAVQNMMGMLGDLLTVLTILSQLSENMQWSSNFPSFLTQILSLLSSSTKKVVSSGPVPPSVRSRL